MKKLVSKIFLCSILMSVAVPMESLASQNESNLQTKGTYIFEKEIADRIYKEAFTNHAGNTFKNKIERVTLPYQKEFDEAVDWFNNEKKEQWYSSYTSDTGEEKQLSAVYLKNPSETTKTVIIGHGLGGTNNMGPWAKLYYDQGYNVLLPQARAYGDSEGDSEKNISLGWKERQDYLKWINQLIDRDGENSQIILTGASMGGTTVLLASSLDLPKNVKAIVADCGFSSQDDLMKHLINKLPLGDNLPQEKLFDKVKIYNSVNDLVMNKQGYRLEDASSVREVRNAKVPVMVIHGMADDLYPASMSQEIYDAIGTEKELFLVPGGPHFQSIATDLPGYTERVSNFIGKFVD